MTAGPKLSPGAPPRPARELGAVIQVVVGQPVTAAKLKCRHDGCLKAQPRCPAGPRQRQAGGDSRRLAAKGPRAGPEGVGTAMPGDSFPQRLAVLALRDVGWVRGDNYLGECLVIKGRARAPRAVEYMPAPREQDSGKRVTAVPRHQLDAWQGHG